MNENMGLEKSVFEPLTIMIKKEEYNLCIFFKLVKSKLILLISGIINTK